jgi:hypothetical protein
VRIRVAFEPRDAWFGVFWNKRRENRVYVCLIPMLPVIVEWEASRPPSA